jgi:OPT family oligopeptide transporter
MALKTLTEEQIQNWSREQKDRWWLENVYRGNMPQLTIRAAITGFFLGGVLSATNLYIGAKTGWTLGVGLTSVILAFAVYRAISSVTQAILRADVLRGPDAPKSLLYRVTKSLGLVDDFTILENNCMQSIATSAGYMTGPLISGLAAYMMVKNDVIPLYQMILFNVVLSILGVLVAFPMKRRFINEEQAPFPEGAACGVVLDTLYTSEASVGMFKAKALAVAALIAGGLKFFAGEAYQTLLQAKILGMKSVTWIAEHLDHNFYAWAAAKKVDTNVVFGIDPRKLGLSPTLDLALLGAGGLMNIRYAVNMIMGAIAAYVFMGPFAVSQGWVYKVNTKTKVLETVTPSTINDYRDVLTGWVLWPGVAILVMGSLTAFFAKPQVIIAAFKGIFARKTDAVDPLKDIEVPLWVSFAGIPLVGAVGVWMAHDWFDVSWQMGALAIPLIIVLTLIAANATAATSITPTGSLSKITQFTFGILRPTQPQVNLMTALMTTEVASNASNLLMDIKPGYMLGAKPRQQAMGHIIGIVAGAIASTPLFYILFLPKHPKNPILPVAADAPNVDIQTALTSGEFGFTGAVQWKAIAEFMGGLTSGKGLTSLLHPSAIWALGIAAVVGIALELARVFTKGKSPLAPVAIGLGFVLNPDSSLWMFLGSFFFWVMHKVYSQKEGSFGKKLWVLTHEPVCAGLIAGAALVGIGDIVVGVLLEK